MSKASPICFLTLTNKSSEIPAMSRDGACDTTILYFTALYLSHPTKGCFRLMCLTPVSYSLSIHSTMTSRCNPYPVTGSLYCPKGWIPIVCRFSWFSGSKLERNQSAPPPPDHLLFLRHRRSKTLYACDPRKQTDQRNVSKASVKVGGGRGETVR